MTQPYSIYQIPGFKGMVSYAGSERLSPGTLKETQNVLNDIPGDLTPRPGLVDSDNFTGVANVPITLFFYSRFPSKFAPQGGAGSGAQSDTQGFTVAGQNTNPGYTSGTQSGGLGGGVGAGGVIKHQHSADTNAQGGHLIEATKVADSTANTIVGTISDVLSTGTDDVGGDKLRVSKGAIEQYLSGAVNEETGYDKVIRPQIIGKVKTADIAKKGTGTFIEFNRDGDTVLGVTNGDVEHASVKNLTGAILGVDTYALIAFDWEGNPYAHTTLDV